MLKNEITKVPTAVEEIVCKPFEQAERFEMNKENTRYLIQLMMGKGKMEIPEKEKPFLMKVIDQRVKGCFGYKIEDQKLQLFIAIISETPGSAIMYLTYLQYWCKKNNCKEIDLEKFCEIFPMGFPSKEDLHKIWEGQKIERDENGNGSDNLLDYQTTMVSIQF